MGDMGDMLSPKVVFSLTTLPSRINRIGPVINSIKNQTLKPDCIYLNVSHGTVVPDFLKGDSAITINFCKDIGPATKLLITLEKETDPETIVITFDDDIYYSSGIAQRLVDSTKNYPNSAIGFNGWNVAPVLDHGFVDSEFIGPLDHNLPKKVDILEGYKSVLYVRKFFDQAIFDYNQAPKEAFYVDDVWFSGHLAKRGIDRIVIPLLNRPLTYHEEWKVYWCVADYEDVDALHSNQNKTRRNQVVANFFKWSPKN
jgi:hypothetical protein